MKLVMHVDLDDKSRVSTGLRNIRNLLDEASDAPHRIRMVAHSQAVRFFTKRQGADFSEQISRLAEQGVEFLICENSIEHLGIASGDLMKECRLVPAGILELVRAQDEGFAYVKP